MLPKSSSFGSDQKSLFAVVRTRRTKLFAYGFAFAFVACTAFLAFNTSSNGSPWFNNLFSSASFSSSTTSYRSQISSLFSCIFPNSSSPSPGKSPSLPRNAGKGVSAGGNKTGNGVGSQKDGILGSKNSTNHGIGSQGSGASGKNQAEDVISAKNPVDGGAGSNKGGNLAAKNQTGSGVSGKNQAENGVSAKNPVDGGPGPKKGGNLAAKNQTGSGISGVSGKNQAGKGVPEKNQAKERVGSKKDGLLPEKNQSVSGVGLQGSGVPSKNQMEKEIGPNGNGVLGNKQKESRASPQENGVRARNQSAIGVSASPQSSKAPAKAGQKSSNLTASFRKKDGSMASTSSSSSGKRDEWINALKDCDIFLGNWVKDDSYPLYPEGTCPHIDEPFNCYLNGRPDQAYPKLRWKPSGCNIPRLNATDMLERLRGKRLVFVGDSLNRNMWESLICALRHSVKDKKKVFEASGRHEFRTEGSYSFIFKDYNCSVEFFRSPFLVQEWEMPVSNGKTKETLRLDIIERSSPRYKDADVLVFNTGHWWTHEKTSKGKDYYQEGDHVYSELNVVDAFHKALTTWAKWVDTNVNPKKTLVFFRGYSASHFSGGQWNSGGQCDNETEPIKNDKYLYPYPPKMHILETVIKGMKTPVSYLNITRMTDYRKDAHPSIYRKQNLTEEERRSPESIVLQGGYRVKYLSNVRKNLEDFMVMSHPYHQLDDASFCRR
ncbi:protein trichome birefringence-like 1 [Cocos nucifera]|uniref:Protein trichome birefringence-like 1 n=1 Tax=Cocos nucifera TaxID=13894 RepID=A0A8K0IHK0_COCNU|nr:protein trichome birefringence-like 1 [Cocos nucifera]